MRKIGRVLLFFSTGSIILAGLCAPAKLSDHPFSPMFARVVSNETNRTNTTLPPANTPMERIILEAAIRYQIHPALIAAMIEVESGWKPYATSPKGAMGLMQLMPQTARLVGVAQPYDVASNILGGVKYLRQMLDRFNGNYLLAIAAYNAGPGAVERFGTVPPYYETIRYLPQVAYWYRYYAKKIAKAMGEDVAAPARRVPKTQPAAKVRAGAKVARRTMWRIIRDA